MSITVERVWELLQQSGLVDGQRLESLRKQFTSSQQTKRDDAAVLVRWLVAQNAITAYHGKVLLAGQPGPFFYGDYLVTKRVHWPVRVPLFGALHLPTKHRVTLLFLDSNQAPGEEQLAQLAQVTRWAAGVVSPHLLRCYELVTAGVYRFFVLERIRGESLAEQLKQGRLPVDRACSIVKDVALGLAHLHQAGQVHGEIRPQNVLLRPEGDTQLVYFPLWRNDPLGPPTNANSPPQLLQPAADYLAPEMITGQDVGPASDLYSLGCLMYHLLAGEPPFGTLDTAEAKVQAHLQTPAPALREKRPEVPEELATVVHALLNKHPQQRYPSALHLVEALGPFESPTRPQPSPPPATAVAFEQHLLQRVVAVGGASGEVPASPQAAATGAAPGASGAAAAVVPGSPASAAAPAGTGAEAAPPSSGAAGPTENALPPGLDFATESSPSAAVAPRRRGRNSSQKLVTVAAAAVGSVLGVMLLLMWLFSGGSSSSQDSAKKPNDGVAQSQTSPGANQGTDSAGGGNGHSHGASSQGPSTGSAPGAVVLRTLQGEPMWNPPTAGPPLEAKYLPNGVQMILSLRPRELLRHPQGKVLLETLGSGTEYALNALAQTSGVPLEQMELAVLGFLQGSSGKPPRVAMVIHTAEPLDAAVLRNRLSGAETARVGTRDVIVAGPWGYYLAGPKQLVVAPVEPLEELQEEESPLQSALANALAPPPLRREMEEMLPWTDSHRTFNLLVAPSFLFAGGKELWQGTARQLQKPAQLFLGEKLQALLASVHLGQEHVFFELRLAATADVAPASLARQFHDKLASLPSTVEDQIAQINISPYSRRILFRFPRMLEQLVNYTDTGVHRRQAVLRCYLPPQAAPNLAFATFLLAVEKQGGGAGGVTVAANQPQQEEPKTLAETLQRKIISLSFPRDTLEQSLMMFGQEIGYEVRILGGDLQLEGITKNQSFGLDLKDRPAGEILRTILQKANPEGKLIYVIRKEGDREVLVITTRKAAQERGDPIPPELQQKSS